MRKFSCKPLFRSSNDWEFLGSIECPLCGSHVSSFLWRDIQKISIFNHKDPQNDNGAWCPASHVLLMDVAAWRLDCLLDLLEGE